MLTSERFLHHEITQDGIILARGARHDGRARVLAADWIDISIHHARAQIAPSVSISMHVPAGT